MAVSVQLPGYNHSAPAVGLAQVLGAGMNAYKDYQQGKVASDQADASARNEQLQKELQNPDSLASQDARTKLAATAQIHLAFGKKAGLSDQDLSPLGELVNYAKNGVTTEGPMPAGVEGPGLPQTRKMSGLEAVQLTDSPLLRGIENFVKGDQSAKAMAQAAQVRAAPQYARLDETTNQNASQAGAAFEHDKIISLAKTNLNSLIRSISILDNPDKPVTAKDLNLAYTDYINAVAAGGAATEGKIVRELPDTWATEWNTLKQKAGENDDLRQSPGGASLINMLRQNIGTVRNDLGSAVAEQARNVHQNYQSNTNPKVRQTVDAKLAEYQKYAPKASAPVGGGGGQGTQPPPNDVAAELRKRGLIK